MNITIRDAFSSVVIRVPHLPCRLSPGQVRRIKRSLSWLHTRKSPRVMGMGAYTADGVAVGLAQVWEDDGEPYWVVGEFET